MERQVIRTYSAGVFFGELDPESRSEDGKRGIIRNARRLWYWDGAASLSELAIRGVKRPKNCKFPAPVDRIEVTEIIEVLDTTYAARESLDSVPVWEA